MSAQSRLHSLACPSASRLLTHSAPSRFASGPWRALLRAVTTCTDKRTVRVEYFARCRATGGFPRLADRPCAGLSAARAAQATEAPTPGQPVGVALCAASLDGPGALSIHKLDTDGMALRPNQICATNDVARPVLMAPSRPDRLLGPAHQGSHVGNARPDRQMSPARQDLHSAIPSWPQTRLTTRTVTPPRRPAPDDAGAAGPARRGPATRAEETTNSTFRRATPGPARGEPSRWWRRGGSQLRARSRAP